MLRIAGWMTVVSLCAVVQAAPLDPGVVGADAKWVVHVDVEAMRDATLVRRVYQREEARQADAAQWAATIARRLFMDPSKDLDAITAYGPKPGSPEGVLILKARADRPRLIEALQGAPGFEEGRYEGVIIYSFTQRDGRAACAFYKDDLVLLARGEEQLRGGLDVLAGRFPSLAKADSPLTQEARAGTLVLVRGVALDEAELPLRNPMAARVKSVDITLGEHQDKVFAEAILKTDAAQTADQIRNIAEGAVALGLLQSGEDPDMAEILRAVKALADGETVSIALRVPVDSVWKALQKAWDEGRLQPRQRQQ
jgi:hypothetical protein